MVTRIEVSGPTWKDEKGRRDTQEALAERGLQVVRVIGDRAGVGLYDLEIEEVEAP